MTKWRLSLVLCLSSTGVFAATPAPQVGQRATAAPPAAAQQQAARPEGFVVLKDARQLGQLCREVALPSSGGDADVVQRRLDEAMARDVRRRALEQVYVVPLGPRDFQVGDYDPAAGRLEIDTTRGFYPMRGQLALWSMEDEALAVQLPAGQVQEIQQAKRQNRLGLTLYTHLDADPDVMDEMDTLKGEPCVTRPGSDAYKLAVSYLGGELVDLRSGRPLARFVTDKGRSTPQVAQRLLGDAKMEVGTIVGAGDGAGEVLRAVQARRGGFEMCYVQHGGNAEGGMALGLDLDESGSLKKVGIDVASLDNEELARCLAKQMADSGLQVASAAGQHVSVPLMWGRGE